MKFLSGILMLLVCTFISFSFINKTEVKPAKSIYSYSINSIDGNPIHLAEFKGKKILFVNVASECGFTPQYAALQKLQVAYEDRLVIIGLPCNQFGGQEPGTEQEIKAFCQKNYGVEFLITEKIEVKGPNQHNLYAWLTSKSLNGKMDSSVKWNFTKYLINENGDLIDQFSSSVKPMSDKITSQL